MHIKFSPTRKAYDGQEVVYEFGSDLIKAKMNGVQDTFDFSSLPDGEAEITSILPENPIERAYRENGELHVILRIFYGENPSYEERFPDWVEV